MYAHHAQNERNGPPQDTLSHLVVITCVDDDCGEHAEPRVVSCRVVDSQCGTKARNETR